MTFDKSRIYIQYLVIAFFIFLLFPPFFYSLPEKGLDNSWNIALNLAYTYDLYFGKDFIFTYGPLGILHARHPVSINLFLYLFFDLYFLVTAFFILKDILKKHFGIGTVFFIFLVLITAMYAALEEWYLFFLLFYLFSFLKEPHRWSCIVQAAVAALIIFYIKVSLGMVGISIFLVTIHYALIRKKFTVSIYASVISLFALGMVISARLLHVSLPGYVMASLHLIDSYNDAMFRNIANEYTIMVYVALLIFFILAARVIYRVIASILKKELTANLDELFIYGILGLCSFVLFKSGFVRGESHFHIFFKGIVMLVTFLYLYSPPKLERKIAACCCWMVLLISLGAANKIERMEERSSLYLSILELRFLPAKAAEVKEYFSGIGSYNKALAASEQLKTQDNGLKKIIGNHTADIIPSEISKIYFNGLRYDPRPVIQSYSAYDTYLDSLDYQKYMSPDAPDYLLFSVAGIDDRFPFFDESRTKLAIFQRYRIIAEYEGDLVLKRREIPRNLVQSKNEKTVTVKFGEDIPVPVSQGLQYTRFHIRYSSWGKIRRFFYQPPALKITFTPENGIPESFRAIKPILEDGVFLNKYVDNNQQLQLLMQSDGRLNTNVKKIRIETEIPGRNTGFADSITLISGYYTFPDKTDPERAEDSAAISALLIRYAPLPLDPSLLRKDSIRFGIQRFRSHSQIVEITGWAFREQTDNKNATVSILLQSKNKIYELPAESISREDIAGYFKRKDIGNSGFRATVSKLLLPPADYQVGIVITNKGYPTRWLTYIPDNHLLIRSSSTVERINPIDPHAPAAKDIHYNIEDHQEQDGGILIGGWAYSEKMDPGETITNLILKKEDLPLKLGTPSKEGIGYRVNTDPTKRSDVSAYFKNPLIEYSGFSTLIPKGRIPAGTYTIGIEEVCCDGKQRSLKFSDKRITITE